MRAVDGGGVGGQVGSDGETAAWGGAVVGEVVTGGGMVIGGHVRSEEAR